jgi:transcription initiation factor IIE alpha subunit
LSEPWSSASLAEALEIDQEKARKILYCLSRARLVSEAGKEGRRKLYARASPPKKGAGG